jgi:hypothetical protein
MLEIIFYLVTFAALIYVLVPIVAGILSVVSTILLYTVAGIVAIIHLIELRLKKAKRSV